MTKEDQTEVIADELLLWIACRKYSRYIVCGWTAACIILGIKLQQYDLIHKAFFWTTETLLWWL